MACMISWQPPLDGRLVPQTAIARPLEISASARTVTKASSVMSPGWLSSASAADPGQRGGQPVDRLAADLAGQLPVGEGADVAHHVADAGPVVPVRSALHEVEVDDDRDRDVHAVRALDRRRDRGWRPGRRCRRWRGWSPPTPSACRSGSPRTWRCRWSCRRRCRPPRRTSGPAACSPRSRAASSVPPATVKMSAERSVGRISSAIFSPWPGPTTTATSPPAEIRPSARMAARSATAPRRTSMASGVMTVRASNGTRSPAPGPGRRGCRPRPSRRRRSRPPRTSPPPVGELLVAVLVVEVRVAPPGRLSASARSAATCGSIRVAPMYSPYACAGSISLVIRVSRPASSKTAFISSSASFLTVSTASRTPGPALGQQGRLHARPGARCRR